MRKDGLGNLTPTGHIEGKRDGESSKALTRRACVNGGGSLTKGEILLRAAGDRELWRAMIAYVLKARGIKMMDLDKVSMKIGDCFLL